MPDAMVVRCFYVLIHGEFDERVQLAPEVPARGFYTSRWVVADGDEAAVRKAFHSAEQELQQWSDVRDGLVGVSMEAEEVRAALGGAGSAAAVEASRFMAKRNDRFPPVPATIDPLRTLAFNICLPPIGEHRCWRSRSPM